MKEYPIKRTACEKKAITIILTWPIFLDILSAPYKKGMLLIVPTVTVTPNKVKTSKCHTKIKTCVLIVKSTH